MKNPILIITAGFLFAVAILTMLVLFTSGWQQPRFWIMAIGALGIAIIALTGSLVLATRKLNPEMKWLPPPFKF